MWKTRLTPFSTPDPYHLEGLRQTTTKEILEQKRPFEISIDVDQPCERYGRINMVELTCFINDAIQSSQPNNLHLIELLSKGNIRSICPSLLISYLERNNGDWFSTISMRKSGISFIGDLPITATGPVSILLSFFN